MRLTILSLAAAALIALSAGDALAWSGGYGGYYGPRGYYGGSGALDFGTIAAQIKAKHSRYGKSLHPRSYYNPPVYYPPLPAGRYGYGYERGYYERGYGYGR